MDAFMLKKIVSRLLFPLPICLELLLAGLFLLWFTKKHKTGRIVVTVGTALLLLLSYDRFSGDLLRGLERSYRPFSLATTDELQVRSRETAVKWIVVLGGGHTADPNIPLSSQLDHSSMVRLVEGVLLHRDNPGSKLIVSGGRVDSSLSDAEVMSNVAEAMGVSHQDIILEDQSRDTEDEARLLKPLVQNDAFILVTSASHMLRSMRLFESYGMHPHPAPTDYLVQDTDTFSPDSVFPEPGALAKATRAVYEYLGLAWLKLRGVI
jgi:uncharacterized SAM-binding protein YcdF (DUF218 family)